MTAPTVVVPEVPGPDEICGGGQHGGEFSTARSSDLVQDNICAYVEVAGKSIGRKIPCFQHRGQPGDLLPDIEFAVHRFRRPIQ